MPRTNTDADTAITRFDPGADIDYGKCMRCSKPLATQPLANEHMEDTGHRVQITNPSREQRVLRHLVLEQEEAMSALFEAVDELVRQGHLTQQEATAAIYRLDDPAEQWSEHCS